MKTSIKYLFLAILLVHSIAVDAATFQVFQGGTGTSSFTTSLPIVGNGLSPLTSTTTLNINQLRAFTSAGLSIYSNNGTAVALFGAGGGSNTTLYGGTNIQGVLSVTGVGTSTFSGNIDVTGNAKVSGSIFAPISLQLSGFTTGSTLFVGPSGTIAQDNSNFYWDDTNNRLGIGTASPGATLDIVSGANRFSFWNGGSNITPGITVGTSAGKAAILQAGSSGTGFVFDQTGFFQIGKDTNANITTGASNGGTGLLRMGANGGLSLGTSYLTTDAGLGSLIMSGSLGIGITTPATPLEAAGAIRSSRSGTASQYLEMSAGTAAGPILTAAGAGKVFTISNTSTGGISFNTNTAGQAMFLQDSGNVGIGTTTPSTTLVLEKTTTPTLTLSLNNTTANGLSAGNIDFVTNDASNAPYGVGVAARISTTDESLGTDFPIIFSTRQGSTGGSVTKRMRITSGGNVGVGTVTPNSTLHVSNSTGASLFRLGTSADGGQAFDIDFDTTNKRINFSPDSSTPTYDISFLQNGGTSMMLLDQSTGNVGIGTTSPMTALSIGSGTTGDKAITLSASTNAYQHRSIFTNSNGLNFGFSNSNTDPTQTFATMTLVPNASNGYVGIGTTTPRSALHIVSGSGTNTNTIFDGTNGAGPSVYFGNSGAMFASIGAAQATISGNSNDLGISADNNIYFESGAGGAKMIINSSGNVGIGTTTPLHMLSVTNPSGSGSNLYVAQFTSNAGANVPLVTYSDVSGSAIVNQTGSLTGAEYVYLGQSGNITFNTAGSEWMRINSTGNVGIGTTSPAVKLDVYGQIRATSPTKPTCTSALYGAIQYDVSADNFYGCKTTGWVLLN